MGRLILVLGGARSGKSTFAQRRARELGGEQVLFVATAGAGDEEMRQRIEKHRRERPAGWQTLEAPQDVGRAIAAYGGTTKVVLVDCLTLLVANRLGGAEEDQDPFAPEIEAGVAAEVQELAACAERLAGDLIVVSNEVGMGLVPPYPLGRAYRDLLGQANRVLAQKADEVYLLVAGIPLVIKGIKGGGG
jgi:adenosylcobinamide kinase/adenosylcobinamide-phosphate guanylyltransferase